VLFIDVFHGAGTYVGGHIAWAKDLLKGPFPQITYDKVFAAGSKPEAKL
jgi:hypothetical protein